MRPPFMRVLRALNRVLCNRRKSFVFNHLLVSAKNPRRALQRSRWQISTDRRVRPVNGVLTLCDSATYAANPRGAVLTSGHFVRVASAGSNLRGVAVPRAEQAPHPDHLAEVVGVVVGRQQSQAEQVAAGAPR